MNEGIEGYICKTEGFSSNGFPKYSEELTKMVRVNHGDIVLADSKGISGKMEFVCAIKKVF